jgi:hypothetical protein
MSGHVRLSGLPFEMSFCSHDQEFGVCMAVSVAGCAGNDVRAMEAALAAATVDEQFTETGDRSSGLSAGKRTSRSQDNWLIWINGDALPSGAPLTMVRRFCDVL